MMDDKDFDAGRLYEAAYTFLEATKRDLAESGIVYREYAVPLEVYQAFENALVAIHQRLYPECKVRS
jgi:hypothetical protein